MRKGNVGIVVNGTVKPSRDVRLGVLHELYSRNCGRPLQFMAGNGTRAANIKAFAENGNVQGLIVCGVRREIVTDFLRLMPNHPPVVLCTYHPLTDAERELLGWGGEVVLDNEAIGVQAADYFIDHGLSNFAFLASNVYRERLAGEIRCRAFERRIKERMGTLSTFTKYIVGVVDANEDYWELGDGGSEAWARTLPRPCGVMVNGDHEAANFLDICKVLGFDVPKDLEVLSINNSLGFCDHVRPTLSSLLPDHEACARKAVEMLLALIDDRELPQEKRQEVVTSCVLVERASTSGGRRYGDLIAHAREFIAANACKGISVMDVVDYVGVSRRLLEKRVRSATGLTILDMIQKVRLELVCHLLATTPLPIAEVVRRCGNFPTHTAFAVFFRKRFGMTMSAYRRQRTEA